MSWATYRVSVSQLREGHVDVTARSPEEAMRKFVERYDSDQVEVEWYDIDGTGDFDVEPRYPPKKLDEGGAS